jgi:type II secretory pathway pseudopilin PulG
MRSRGYTLVGTLAFVILVGILSSVLLLVEQGGMRLEPSERSERRVEELRHALDRYREDHGWYPGDPNKDYNSDGDAELLVKQLTWFTRDDGKPADRRDADYCLGPYLRELPVEPASDSRAIVVDQDQARVLSRLRADLQAGSGRGGWYYEALTGNIEANTGRGALASSRSDSPNP